MTQAKRTSRCTGCRESWLKYTDQHWRGELLRVARLHGHTMGKRCKVRGQELVWSRRAVRSEGASWTWGMRGRSRNMLMEAILSLCYRPKWILHGAVVCVFGFRLTFTKQIMSNLWQSSVPSNVCQYWLVCYCCCFCWCSFYTSTLWQVLDKIGTQTKPSG